MSLVVIDVLGWQREVRGRASRRFSAIRLLSTPIARHGNCGWPALRHFFHGEPFGYVALLLSRSLTRPPPRSFQTSNLVERQHELFAARVAAWSDSMQCRLFAAGKRRFDHGSCRVVIPYFTLLPTMKWPLCQAQGSTGARFL